MLLLDIIVNNIIKEADMTTDNPSIAKLFQGITDPRSDNKRHKLMDIITIAICAVICNADSFEDIAEFGKAKYDSLVKRRGFKFFKL